MSIGFGIVGSWGLLLIISLYYFKDLFRYDTDSSEPDNEYIYLIVDNDSLNRENVQMVFSVHDRYDGSPLQ